ncbi:MAG: hypothetical protein ACOCYT_00270 [Chloroflexota bacterium]
MMTIGVAALVLAFGLGLLLAAGRPVAAQGLVFVTNTPQGTPVPPMFMQAEPEGSLNEYALRLWREADLLAVLTDQVGRLARGDAEQARAVRYTLYELDRRFPGAPNDPAARAALVRDMLAAPRGTVDIDAVARPYVMRLFNQALDVFPPVVSRGVITTEGFAINYQLADLNGDEAADAVIEVRYPAGVDDAALRYHVILPVVAGDTGYVLVPMPDDLPAAPFDTPALSLVVVDDLNADGLADVMLRAQDSRINDRLWLVGWRSGEIIDLVAPADPMLIGRAEAPRQIGTEVQVNVYRVESERWDCTSSLPVTWRYSANFYRPSTALNARYTDRETFGCMLARLEPPLFERPPESAAALLSGMLATVEPGVPGYDRGALALAMLYVLDDRADRAAEYLADPEGALVTALAADPGNAWLNGQVRALESALSNTQTPVQVCAALLAQNLDGACDLVGVITRLLADSPITLAGDLRGQLENLGLPVRQIETVRQVGRADRQYVRFNLTGTGWWSFAPTGDEFYVPSPADQPPGFAEQLIAAPATLDVLPTAFDALINADDPVTALNILENAQGDNPGSVLGFEGRYLRALALELTGERIAARDAYYRLWVDAAGTIWGPLAGAHVERR